MKEVKLQFTKTMTTLIVIVAALAFYFGYSVANLYPLTGRLQANTEQPSGGTQAAQPTQPNQPIKFSIPDFAPYRGSSNAKINMVEFGDYQCPFCERHFSQTEPQIKQNYIDTGKVKYFFLDFAFLGPDSQTLGEGAWCANDQGLYYDYYDYIYSHQGQENSGWATPEKVKTMVKNIAGLNSQQFDSCLDSGKYTQRVKQNTQLGQNSGIDGTPGFLIGNDKIGYTLIRGAYPYASFQQILDAALRQV